MDPNLDSNSKFKILRVEGGDRCCVDGDGCDLDSSDVGGDNGVVVVAKVIMIVVKVIVNGMMIVRVVGGEST